MESDFKRGGVPVFSLPALRVMPRMLSANAEEAGSPTRPPGVWKSPMCILPAKNVPAVRMTASAK